MNDILNRADLCFVVDTTGSMGPFIDAAKAHLTDVVEALGRDHRMDLHVGLVEFRDHPPQDRSFVTRVYPLSGNRKETRKVINRLHPDGGGDGPEAVYDGVRDACTGIDWRPYSCRFILLVGDSPPHGAWSLVEGPAEGGRGRPGGHGDAWPDGCPCGLTAKSVAAAAESVQATVHALCMGEAPVTTAAFLRIAQGTGGACTAARNADAVVARIVDVLNAEFEDVRFDEQVLRTASHLDSLDAQTLAESLGCPRLQTAASVARLGRRGLLARVR